VKQERESPSYAPIVVVVAASFILMLWYATSKFVPYIWLFDRGIGYDAFRYHIFAQRNAQYSLLEILSSYDVGEFSQTGYPVLLSQLYRLITPDPLVGCVFNWLLWVAAGFLLIPLAKPESGFYTPLPFLALWLLYPEGIDWTGTTSKEPLVAFAVACAIRACSSRAPRWAQLLIVGALAALMLWVRSVVAPLIVLAFAISFEFRRVSPRSAWSRTIMLAVAAVVALYVAGGNPADEEDTNNPLANAGYSQMEQAFYEDLSSRSVLRRTGSPDRVMDSFYVPIRGLTHLVCPLYFDPFALPFAAAAQPSGMIWLSAGVCSSAALAILLGLVDRRLWTRNRAILFGVLVLGLMGLGLSGLIHERYRSIIVAALLPLGMRSVREEIAVHGPRRLLIGGAVLPVFVFLLYRILRQLS